MTDLYIAQHEGLVMIHRALADAFAPIVAGAQRPLDQLIPQTRGAAGFLLAHHDLESHVLFPGLRKHGRLRSTDVAFLDGREREHRDIHALTESLLATCGALHPHSATIATQARELMQMLAAHVREEEDGLAPERLRTMIDDAGFAALQAELDAARDAALARMAAAGIAPPDGVRR
jgi:hypothetical protein